MRVLVIDAIAPEGPAYLRERGLDVDEVSGTLSKPELYGRLGDYEADRHALVDHGHAGVPRARAEAPHSRAGRSRRGQHRRRRVLAPRRRRRQRALRQRGLCRRAHRGHAPRARPEDPRGPRRAQALRMGPGHLRRRALPEDGRASSGSARSARASPRDCAPSTSTVLVYDPYIPRAARESSACGSPTSAPCSRRSDVVTVHVPLTDETDGHARGPRDRIDEARRAHRQLRARRHRPRGRPARRARGRATWRAPRSTCGARSRPSRDLVKRLDRPSASRRHPAPRRQHAGGAGQRRRRRGARQSSPSGTASWSSTPSTCPWATATPIAAQRPFLALAETLGRFCVQLEPDNVERVEVDGRRPGGRAAIPS